MTLRSQTTDSTPPGPPPFAIAELLDRCMGNADIATLLLDKFEKQLQSDVRAIDCQATAGDTKQLAHTAHALKGAAGAVASPVLRDVAAKLESLAKDNRLDLLVHELSSLRMEVDRVLAFLPDARNSLKCGTTGRPAGPETRP